MNYMVKQLGGHQHVGFTQKDMYNHVDAMRRIEIKDGDVEVVLAYLCGKAEMDSSFFYKPKTSLKQNIKYEENTRVMERRGGSGNIALFTSKPKKPQI